MASDAEVADTVEDGQRSASAIDPTDLPRGATLDRYVVIDKVGQGGMGVVYAAYDHVLDRKVALKLVTSRGGQDGASLLLAEARAMAQLSHPAIVPVHDVGELGGQVFLAMAYIDGATLRAWQTRPGRGWRELVAMYRTLGEGLAFAHDEGIIHRDFKPDNVLVDEDGRPHITDFGLAKIVLASEPASHTTPGTHTITGRIAGTPGYMSPQQARGEPTDAATDQYAFCAALFEALHGGLPRDQPALRADLPRRIALAIARGLEDDPARRFPSMRELLAALTPRAPARRARITVATAALGAALGLGLVLHRGAPRARCELPRARALWQARGGQVRAASGGELADALDAWTARWTAMAEASCHATADGAQSAQLLDLRTRCLDHALDVTSSVIELASRGDPDLVRHAARAAAALPPLEPCADTAGLLGEAPLPNDPLERGVIDALGHSLARVEALEVGESLKAATDLLDSLAAPIAATHYPPLLFELYSERTTIEITKQTDPDAAATAAWAAIAVDPARHDAKVAGLWIDLVWIVGEMQHAPVQAIEIGQVAQAIEARVQDRHQLALLDHRLGVVLVHAGKLDEAIPHEEHAIAEFAAESDVADEVAALGGEATVYAARDDTAKQIALYQRSIALAEKAPHAQLILADQLMELAIVYTELQRYREATDALDRALAAAGDGTDMPSLFAAIHGNLGNVAERAGDLAKAETEYRTEVEIARDKLGTDVSDLEIAYFNLGTIELKRHELADALDALHRSEDILTRSPRDAADSVDYASPGEIANQLVEVQLALAHPAAALADAEACLAIAERDGAHAKTLADDHFALATAAWAAGERDRARTTMRVAAVEYRAAGAPSDDADHWLAAH
ncbi:MAG TPA: serine/threonine-protein kinase [Kofleriaceae bacterium]|nr:serine/threonine-protein kinase [Kofleriaceae bacterium]